MFTKKKKNRSTPIGQSNTKLKCIFSHLSVTTTPLPTLLTFPADVYIFPLPNRTISSLYMYVCMYLFIRNIIEIFRISQLNNTWIYKEFYKRNIVNLKKK